MKLKLYLYRSLDVDGDGDPLDHGVVRAADLEAAAQLVEDRMREILGDDDDGWAITVRFYPLLDDGREGVLEGEDFFDREVSS